MNLSFDGDTLNIETDREDKELAEATYRVLSGTHDIIETLGVAECDWCDDRGRLRPYQLKVDGELQVLDICEDCQRGFVEDAMEQGRADEQAIDDLVEEAESENPDLPDGVTEDDLTDA